MRHASSSELLELAHVVVVGDVAASEAMWRGQRIYTQHTIEVREVLKGNKIVKLTRHAEKTEITLLTLGGVVGDIGQRVGGAAKLSPNKRYLLYLVHHSDGFYYPVAMAQGAIQLAADAKLPRLEDLGGGLR